MKKIFSLKLATELINRDNVLLGTEQNKDNPKYKVFIFLNTEKLQADITKIMQNNN